MKIKVPVAKPFIDQNEARAVFSTIRSGWISSGKVTKKFEKKFAKYVGAKFAIAVNNGTAALHLCLKALKLKPGDEIIIPDITFISTFNVVIYENATPVIVNSCPRCYNICPSEIKKKITKNTKAIIGVDMNGMPFNYDIIKKICKKRNILLIADSAESFGATYKNKKIGSIAPIHAFSFFANKNITTGEGGMVTTNNSKFFKKLNMIKNQGQLSRYNHVVLGYNYRMTDLIASFGLEQLKKIKTIIVKKNRAANYYNKKLTEIKNILIPRFPDYKCTSSWYNYTISLPNEKKRNLLVKQLNKKGIDTRLSFPPLHTQIVVKNILNINKKFFKKSYDAWSRLINLPIYPGITLREQNYVIKSIKKIMLN
jgi:perosamine synthetase